MKTFLVWLAAGFVAGAVLVGSGGGLYYLSLLLKTPAVQEQPEMVIRPQNPDYYLLDQYLLTSDPQYLLAQYLLTSDPALFQYLSDP